MQLFVMFQGDWRFDINADLQDFAQIPILILAYDNNYLSQKLRFCFYTDTQLAEKWNDYRESLDFV